MQPAKISGIFRIVIFCLTFATTLSFAVNEDILHSFKGGTDGAGPWGSLTFDRAGHLYGATGSGGTGTGIECGGRGCGTIFRLQKVSNSWTESVIYNFAGDPDGSLPNGDLVIDSQGNIYGTTYTGGANDYGAVFELKRSSTGWTESVLHSFASGTDGVWPMAGLVLDSDGNLYGTASGGGDGGGLGGIVFQLIRSSSGWTYKVLHVFGSGTDGAAPYSRLTMDGTSRLFGTTGWGGASTACGPYGCGTVFELTRGSGGVWTESVIHNFVAGSEASYPYGPVALDSTGNLYGTTFYSGDGMVFEMSPVENGTWTEQVIFTFMNFDAGYLPYAGLVIDGVGNLYGATVFGGDLGNCKYGTTEDYCGTVFELATVNGVWTETVLHAFNRFNGGEPYSTLIFDVNGNLYGTTGLGGFFNDGVVYEITP